MTQETFLIPHDFYDPRVFPPGQERPYEYTPAMLRDEMVKRTTDLDIIATASEDETREHLGQADFMVAVSLSADRFARAEKLRWIHTFSAGADHFFKLSGVDADDFRRRGIVMTTSIGAASVVLAEQLLCYMLMFSCKMNRAVRQQIDGLWQPYLSGELSGGTLGIIGIGSIGSRLAMLAKCLGMRVIATKRDPTKHDGVADQVLPGDQYETVFRQADYLVMTCPITEATRRLVNAETLAMMKPTAFLLNLSRGECIDEAALVEALRTGVIAGYAGDNHGDASGPVTFDNMEVLSPESPLWGMENVIITPNCASASPRRLEYMADVIVDNYTCIKAGRSPTTRLVWQGQPV